MLLSDEKYSAIYQSVQNGTLKTDPTKSVAKLELVGDKLRFTSNIYTPTKQSGQQLMNKTVRQTDAFNRGMAWGGGITGVAALPFMLSN